MSSSAVEFSLSPSFKTEADLSAEDLIHWRPNDPENPFNYPLWKKIMITTTVCLQISWLVMLSSCAAAIGPDLQEEFGIPAIESRLSVAMFLFGFALGPVFLTPLAEDYGRKKVFGICLLIVYIFQIPCALAKNHATIVVSRLIGGFFGSPIFNSVGNIPDLWHGNDPTGLWAMNGWAFSAECLLLGPIIAAYINHSLGWRWVFGIWGIVGGGLLVVFLLLVPETRGGIILAARAARARKNGHRRAWAIHEKLGRRSLGQIVKETILRPAVMLFTEPIVYCFALYDGLNYAVIYLSVEAAPLVYAQYGLTDPGINLVFFSILIGIALAIPCFYLQLLATRYAEKRARRTNVPEHKLLWAFPGAVLFPISLYWFAWTARPPINMYSSLCAYGIFGLGSHIWTYFYLLQMPSANTPLVFLAVSDFTVESYGLMASSAVTGQSFARETICGVLSLVAVPFYTNVGYEWASTIIAILATVMAAFPYIFYRYGPKIRAASRYAQELAQLELEEQRLEKWIEAKYREQQEGVVP